ncbi:MAG: helix-turn-helix domain-containing protein [Oscillibacter sp.]|nr:helix-turn-helix domain-containing protein [Oscillibacter sp.]
MNIDTRATLSSRIKEARAKKFLSQRELAERAGVSLSLIGQLENGTRNTSPKTLYRLAEILEVDAEWLASGDGECVVGEDKYKTQFESILELVNLLQTPQTERKFLIGYAQLNLALTELTRALKDRQALDDGEIPTMEVELEALKRIEFYAKSCCNCFAELANVYPEGHDRIGKRFREWQSEKQKFSDLLVEYNKMNLVGRTLVVNTAASLAAMPQYQKKSPFDNFNWKDVGPKLKRFREEKQLSLQEVGERSGLGETYVRDVETCYRFPRAKELCRIATAIDVRLTEVLPFSEEDKAEMDGLYDKHHKWLDEHDADTDDTTKKIVSDAFMQLYEGKVDSVMTEIRARESSRRARLVK